MKNISILFQTQILSTHINHVCYCFQVQAFSNSGTNNRNYKGQFSFVLFALVDANYQFMFVDIGQPGTVLSGFNVVA